MFILTYLVDISSVIGAFILVVVMFSLIISAGIIQVECS